jgi:hypothetical protein
MENEVIARQVEDMFERSDERIHAIYTKILDLIHNEEQDNE